MNRPKLWTKDFIIVSTANFFLYFTFYLLMATVTIFATDRFHASPSAAGLASGIFVVGVLVARYAFELAQKRNRRLTSATKSNGIFHTMPFWDEVFNELKADYPDVAVNSTHIDALSAFLVIKPELFDVIVASNLFGDILTDIGGAIMGSIGIAPSANINLNGKYPSMFEPVHGSAPDIAGKGIANPIGQIWTAKMMLDHFGETELGGKILEAVEWVIAKGIKTPDIGGTATTAEVTEAVCGRILEK